MSSRVTAFLCVLFFLVASPCIAGDSTSLSPSGDSGTEHDVETYGGEVKTSGGDVNTGSGHVRTKGGVVYTRGGRVRTHGGDIESRGGNINAGGGWVKGASGVKTKRIYDYGSGGWIRVKDHLDMENNVLYDVKRIRMNDTWPNRNDEVATKRYVDAKSSSLENCKICVLMYEENDYNGWSSGNAECRSVNGGWTSISSVRLRQSGPVDAETDFVGSRVKFVCP